MKKLLIQCTTGIISFVVLTSCVLAQSPKPASTFSSLNSTEGSYAQANPKNKLRGVHPAVNIHSRALKNFYKTYKTEAAKWFEMKNGFLAEFHENGVKTKVFYNRKGNLTGSIRNYSEEQLPKNIRHLVKSTYYDYVIYLVQEVKVGNTVAYLVKIEDKKSFKTIRVIDGEMDEYEAFDKANK